MDKQRIAKSDANLPMGASSLFCETTNVLLRKHKEIKMGILGLFQDLQNARKIYLLSNQFQYIKIYLILKRKTKQK